MVVERLGSDQPIRWRLNGDDERYATAIEVRAAAADKEPLQVSVSKLLNEPDKSDRIARIDVDGAGLGLPLTTEEATVLADDAARRVLAQLKTSGVRGRVRVEFEVTGPDGQVARDSRPGAVRKIARGEPVGASADRRDRRRRSRGRGRKRVPTSGAEGRGERHRQRARRRSSPTRPAASEIS